MRSARYVLAAASLMLLTLASTRPAGAQTFTTIDRFSTATGAAPGAALIQATNGDLYGTTLFGGANSEGTLFKLTPAGRMSVVTNFTLPRTVAAAAGVIQATDGKFYGIDPDGGTNSSGMVYKVTPSGTMSTVYSFCAQAGCPDGQTPAAALIQGSDGNLYGTTANGGANGMGTVFTVTLGGTLRTLYSFCSQSSCTDGIVPTSTLVQGTDGNFYGTTQQGGSSGNNGTVFKITPAGTLTTLYSFCSQPSCADGQYSLVGLTQAADGNLYGTTLFGGANGQGTVFQLTTGGVLTTLYSFCSQSNCADGMTSESALIQATDGNLYGATYAGGGATGSGTLYRITTSGTLTTLYSFCSQPSCSDGTNTTTTLLQDTNGTLYGSAVYGGTNNLGTIFSLSLGLGHFVALQTTAGAVGTPVKILGTSLTGATAVTFNGTSAKFRVVSAAEISVTVPAGATTGHVLVTTPGGVLSSSTVFTVEHKSATPVFSLASGTYTGAQTVKITDATAGAAIFYSTDGSTPTTASNVYTGPFTVGVSETLKAIALASGHAPSAAQSATYTIN